MGASVDLEQATANAIVSTKPAAAAHALAIFLRSRKHHTAEAMRRWARIVLVALLVPPTVACAGNGAPPAAPPSADRIVAAFIEASQAADRSMHLESTEQQQSSEVRRTPGLRSRLDVTVSLDIQAGDHAGLLTAFSSETPDDPQATPRVEADFRMMTIVTGGGAYVRWDDDEWLTVTSWREFDPLAGLTADDVTYVGSEIVEGRSLHHLQAHDPVAAYRRLYADHDREGSRPSSILAEYDFDEAAAFDIWVDEAGIPTVATLSVGWSSSYFVDTASLRFEFSRWGDTFEIVAPTGPEGRQGHPTGVGRACSCYRGLPL